MREWVYPILGSFRMMRDREEELQFHLEQETQDAIRCGQSPREARWRAGQVSQALENPRRSGVRLAEGFLARLRLWNSSSAPESCIYHR